MIRDTACFGFRNSSGQNRELARVLKYMPRISRMGCAAHLALTRIAAEMW